MDDDLLEADKLSKMVPILRDNPGITLVSSVRGVVDEYDNIVQSDSLLNVPIPEDQEYGYFYGEDMARQMLLSTKNLIGEPSAVLFRRDDLTHHYWQAEAKGYKYFDWNVSSGDAGGTKETDVVYQNVISGIQSNAKRGRASVVLQHDVKGYSVDAVARIIQWGLQNGYTFMPLSENSPTAHHNIAN
jgi:peptidoglycan/xylan/chitin deacetylase (PgdA/CDA1 family)